MLGGDLPFLKKFLGLTEHWYIPSVHNLGLWNPLKRRYLGCHRRRTRTGDASRLGKTPVCKEARGCASKPLLQVPRHHAIICVLHMLMRIGALLGEYLERLCLSASREARNAINNMLKIALCCWQLGGTCRPDGQETKRLFFIWDGIAHVLGLADEHLGNQAVMRLRDVMQRLYRTYQRIDIDLPADCRQAAWEFRAHCLPETRSHYLIILEFDVPRIIEAIAPYGLGMYCQDLAETTNAKLKDFYLQFTNRGDSTTDDYQLSALLQTMEHAFLYTHSDIVAHGTARPISCPNAALFESLIDDAAQWC